jgi:hypothetical protein
MKCFIPAGLLAATLLLGCSDDHEPTPPATDAGVDARADVAAEGGARPDVSADVSRGDGFFDLFDVFPLPDAGCPNCIRDRCGAQLNACINNPACISGLLCTAQMCGVLGEGGLNPSAFLCVLGCFNGDQATALSAIGGLQCLTMTCGSVCNFLDAGGGGFDVRPPDASDVSVDSPTADATPDVTDIDATDDVSPDHGPDTGAPDAGSDVEADADVHVEAGADARADDAEDGQADDGASSDAEPDAIPPSDGAPPDDVADASNPDGAGSD